MPQLKCTVQTCVHNKQFLCDLDEITVGGESAKNPKETCCEKGRKLHKFYERGFRLFLR